MKVKMILKSDAIFGNGMSMPGGEDISVLIDKNGFPYYKATAFKGVFREEMANLLYWEGKTKEDVNRILNKNLGGENDCLLEQDGKIRFSNFTLSESIREEVLKQVRKDSKIENINENEAGMKAPDESDIILRSFSYLRTFTALGENGLIKDKSLRECRCLKKGLIFYGTIECKEREEELVRQVLKCIKWLGSMRTRGFGYVKLEVIR